MDMSQYLGIFLDEAREHLQAMNEGLLALETNPKDSAVIERIFRAAHTLKGMSATMGFSAVAELTHAMESVLDKFRQKQLEVKPESMDVLFRCLDVLEGFTNAVAAGQDVALDPSTLIKELQGLAGGGGKTTATARPMPSPAPSPPAKAPEAATPDQPAGSSDDGLGGWGDRGLVGPALELTDEELAALAEAQATAYRLYQVTVELDEQCILKSARAYLVVRNLEDQGRVFHVQPPVEALEEDKFARVFGLVYASRLMGEEVLNLIRSVSEISRALVVPYELPRVAQATKEGAAPQEQAAEPVAAPVGQEASAAASASAKPATQGEALAAKLTSTGTHQAVRPTVRVDIEKLDSLMNLVGELVINRSRLTQIGTQNKVPMLGETIEELARITTDLQGLVMKARMVPIDQVFNRFPRMVRDLARELGKEINLVIEGHETELDRTVVDEIGDPLVHLLRNAVDHGIEPPEVRQAKGKNPAGEVRITARHEGNQVVVEVSDDGMGVDPAKVKAKAIEKGLITAEEAAQMSDHEAYSLLFRSGFSTAEKVTDISGRGVGLDVVTTKIQSLNGTVELQSKPGMGSRFIIKLPLTLAIIQALLVQLGQREVYALPLENIEEIIKVAQNALKPIQHAEYLLFRGQVIPVIRLGTLFATPDAGGGEGELDVVVVKSGGRRLGLVVDHLLGQQEIVIKSLDSLFSDVRGFAGATILGDGKVALILDVLSLLRSEATGHTSLKVGA
ncbi:MAG: chemotaxis protein CheA [Betaproteobacteria bacterium]